MTQVASVFFKRLAIVILFSLVVGIIFFLNFFEGPPPPKAATDSTDIAVAPYRDDDTTYGPYLALSHAEDAADFDRAADLLDLLLEEQPDSPNLLRRALLANLYAGRMDRAVALAPNVVAQFPDTLAIANLLVATEAIQKEDWEAARAVLQDRQRLVLARFITPTVLAWIAASEGKTDQAIEELTELRDEQLVSDLHDYNAALIFLDAGRSAEAEAILSVYADDLQQAPILILRTLARARLATDGIQAAEALLAEYQATVGQIDRITLDIKSLADSGTLAPLSEGPSEAIAQSMIELAIRISRQAPRIALHYLRTAIHFDPGNDLGRIFVGSIMQRFDRYEAAIQVLQEVPETSAHQWVAQQEIAENLIALERDEEAITIYEAMAKERTDDVLPFERLGGLMRTRERFEEGVAYYDKALALSDPDAPSSWRLFYGRGICYERTKQWDKAEPDFLTALELNPNEPAILNYLGYSWVDQGINLQDGLDLIKKAVSQRPNDAYIIDSLGWVHYRLGNFEEAVVQLERSVQLRPGNAVINDHLGDAYWHVGRRTEARFQWERSRFLEDADEVLRARIDAKLERGLDAVEAEEAVAE